MQVQSADLSASAFSRTSPQKRFVMIGIVGAIHVAAIYAVATGMLHPTKLFVPPDLVAVPVPDTPPPTKTDTDLPKNIEETFDKPRQPVAIPPDFTIDQPRINTIVTTRHVDPPPPQPSPAQGITNTHTIPPYPEFAIRALQSGTVTLRLGIGADGNVTSAEVANSSGSVTLDEAAVAWVKSHWRYHPATREGTAVASTTMAAVKFDLKNAR